MHKSKSLKRSRKTRKSYRKSWKRTLKKSLKKKQKSKKLKSYSPKTVTLLKFKNVPPIYDMLNPSEEFDIEEEDLKIVNGEYNLEDVSFDELIKIIKRRGYYGLDNKAECEELVWKDGGLSESRLFNQIEKIGEDSMGGKKIIIINKLRKDLDTELYNELSIYYKGENSNEKIRCRRTDCIEYMKKKHMDMEIIEQIIINIAENPRYFKWVSENGLIPYDERTIWVAAYYGYIDILKLLIDQYKGIPHQLAAEYAIRGVGDKFEILKILRAKKYPINNRVYEFAVEKNYNDIINWFKSSGILNELRGETNQILRLFR